MAGFVKDLPLNSATGASETVPWATGGTTLAPSAVEQETGWQPQAVAGPPDYRLENYARKTQSDLNFRANQSALFLEYALAEVNLTGVNPGVNIRSITVDGNTVTYTDQPGDTEATVKDAFVTLLNADLAIAADARASHDNPLSPIQILGLNPGVNIVVSAAVVAGAGTITATGPTDTIMRGADTAWYAADMVIGSPEVNDDGDPNHDARIVWDKANYAFRAGKVTGTQWDNGNRGRGSVAMGTNCKAAGDGAFAAGDTSDASAEIAIALGFGSTASDVGAVAIAGSTASGQNALAMMGGSASAGDAIAIGSNAAASAAAVALGRETEASAIGAVALGNGETDTVLANAAHSLAHGDRSNAGAKFSRSTGYGARTTAHGETAHSNYGPVGVEGKHQSGTIQLTATLVGAGGLKMTLDKVDGTGSEWDMGAYNYAVDFKVICKGTGHAAWVGSGMVYYAGGVSNLVGGWAAGALAPTYNFGGASALYTVTFTITGTTTLRCTAATSGLESGDFQLEIQYTRIG